MKKYLICLFFITSALPLTLNLFAQNIQPHMDEQKRETLKKKLVDQNQLEILELKKKAESKERAGEALQRKKNALEEKATTSNTVPPSNSGNSETSVTGENLKTTNFRVSKTAYKEEFTTDTNVKKETAKFPLASSNPTAPFTIDCNRDRDTRYKKQICQWAEDTVTDSSSRGIATLNLTLRDDLLLMIVFGKLLQSGKISVDPAVKKFLVDVEDSRLDKQVGANSDSSGTTSLAVKGGVPAFLNWAVENGAASSTTSGTTTTFRINPVGFVESITGSAPVSIEPPYTPNSLLGNLKRTSIGLSFDISRGSTPNIFTGDKQQLSAISFRYEFINQRNDYKENLKKFFEGGIPDAVVTGQLNTFKALLNPPTIVAGLPAFSTFKNTELEKWRMNTFAAVGALSKAGKSDDQQLIAIEDEINKQLDLLPVDELAKEKILVDSLLNFVSISSDYVAQTTSLLKAARRGTVFTFEYTNNREIDTTDTSNIQLIYERNTFFDMDLTINGSFTFFHKKPVDPTVKRIKDFNFAVQFDKPFSFTGKGKKNAVFTFAGKYQRLDGDAVALDGTVLPDTKGDIAIGQVKLIVPLFRGIKFPISATFANRTELVREREVRGNFGLTFDVDTLLTIIRKP